MYDVNDDAQIQKVNSNGQATENYGIIYFIVGGFIALTYSISVNITWGTNAVVSQTITR